MSKEISQHKRLAMGDREDARYKSGGPIVTPRLSSKPKGMPMNPITKAKMQNGVPGLKKGGKCK